MYMYMCRSEYVSLHMTHLGCFPVCGAYDVSLYTCER